ncbi:hypothetical protein C0995_007851 [Termitomyces sp. Mi166|nr:hypothetical protein C0995_007851 [Termitomyces sp. Mi166\
MYNVELLLRSTKTLSQEIMIPQELERLRDQFGAEEEERIRERLEKIAYTIDSPATMSLVTGPGRIERREASRSLRAIFQQMHVDVERKFENFAFDMPGEDDDVNNCPENIPIDISKFGVQRRPDCSEQSPLIRDKPVDYEPGVLQLL